MIGGVVLLLSACSAFEYQVAKTDWQDCQWLRIFLLRPTCHEYVAHQPPPPDDTPRFCYRSLGGVDCQSEPDPTRTLVGNG